MRGGGAGGRERRRRRSHSLPPPPANVGLSFRVVFDSDRRAAGCASPPREPSLSLSLSSSLSEAGRGPPAPACCSLSHVAPSPCAPLPVHGPATPPPPPAAALSCCSPAAAGPSFRPARRPVAALPARCEEVDWKAGRERLALSECCARRRRLDSCLLPRLWRAVRGRVRRGARARAGSWCCGRMRRARGLCAWRRRVRRRRQGGERRRGGHSVHSHVPLDPPRAHPLSAVPLGVPAARNGAATLHTRVAPGLPPRRALGGRVSPAAEHGGGGWWCEAPSSGPPAPPGCRRLPPPPPPHAGLARARGVGTAAQKTPALVVGRAAGPRYERAGWGRVRAGGGGTRRACRFRALEMAAIRTFPPTLG